MSTEPSDDSTEKPSVTSISGGMNVDAQHDVNLGGDAVGRDKIESAGANIVHAAPGSTVIIGERPAPEPEDLSPAPGEPPFKGLQYFDEADACLFFGRERLTAKLVEQLSKQRFLAVVGASGSGKSSVVRAGVIPALRRGVRLVDGTLPPDGSTGWPVHVITPTTYPLEALAATLTRDSESVTATATLIDDLARDPRSLHLTVRKILSRTPSAVATAENREARGSRLLLVVDQFEELFTLCRSEAERKAFVDNLLYAGGASSPVDIGEGWEGGDGPTLVVIALRADFYAHCAQFDQLREALAKHQAFIGAMNADELRQAIEEPAKHADWEFEPGLVDLLLRDAGDGPGALPLLSHALLETWRRRRQRTLTLEGYAESGGVHGAIARTAETVFNQRLTPKQQSIARNLFLRLTELGEGTQDTRRRAALSELILRPEDRPSVEAVLKTLADARLITTEQETVEVAHEALIREWPTLRSWLDTDREGLRIHRQLTEDAHEWAMLQRDEGALYRGARLAAASEWAKEHAGELNTLERDFLEASRGLQVSELEAERKRSAQLRRRAIYLGVALVFAMLMAVVAGFLGWQANRNAIEADQQRQTALDQQAKAEQQRQIAEAQKLEKEQQQQIALARQLAAQAAVERDRSGNSWQIAGLLVAESLRRDPAIPETVALAYRILESTAHLLAWAEHDVPVHTVEFSPDGHWVASGNGVDWGELRVWDAATGQEAFRARLQDAVSHIAFSMDSKRITVNGFDKVRIWDIDAGRELASIQGAAEVIFTTDGRYLVANKMRESLPTIQIQDASTGNVYYEWVLSKPSYDYTMELGRDGRLIAVADNNNHELFVFDIAHKRTIMDLELEASVADMAISSDGQWVSVASDNGTVVIWDVITQNKVKVFETSATRITFSRDSRWLASVGDTGETANPAGVVSVWSTKDWSKIAELKHENLVNVIAFSPDSQWLVTAEDCPMASISCQAFARVWEAGTDHELARMEHRGTVNAVAIAPNAARIATGSEDGMARVWEIIKGRSATRRQHEGIVYTAAYSPDGKSIASGGNDNQAMIWNATSGQGIAPLFHDNWVRALEFSPDSNYLVTGSDDNLLHLWDNQSKQELDKVKLKNWIWAIAFDPHDQWLAVSSGDPQGPGQLSILRIKEGKLQRLEEIDWPYLAPALVVTTGGDKIILGNSNGSITIVNPDNLGVVKSFGQQSSVLGLAVSANGNFLASVGGAQDGHGFMQLWDLQSGTSITLLQQAKPMLAVAFSPDSQWLAFGGQDGVMHLTGVASAQDLARLEYNAPIRAVSFSPDGHQIAVGSGNQVEAFYWWSNVLDELCHRLNRNFTKEEWQAYLGTEPYRPTCSNLP
jgi:WD40 repeat protein